MEARLNTLASNITTMIREFLETEVNEYRENYEYMLGSPLCLRLLREIETLKAQNEKLSKPNIELEITEDENESSYDYDRKYKNDTSKSYPADALARVMLPSMLRKNGLMSESSEVGSSNSSRAIVLLFCLRRLLAFLSTL